MFKMIHFEDGNSRMIRREGFLNHPECSTLSYGRFIVFLDSDNVRHCGLGFRSPAEEKMEPIFP
jgi:hypothetical protein